MPRWRWCNVPIPEPHIGFLGASLALTVLKPLRLTSRTSIRATSFPLIATGVGLTAWAVRSAGAIDLADPQSLTRHGPYRFSRNPMYIGWMLMYLGVGAALNTAWTMILVPALAVVVHRQVATEEQQLEDRFGERYHRYRQQVRRYV